MAPLRIHYFQHVPFEGLASIEEWARRRGHMLSCTHFYEPQPKLPVIDEIDWLIIMGGPMGTYEEELHPWLRVEKKLVREAIDAGKIVFGICLGAQLIANALGCAVYPHKHKEIGWWPVRTTAAAREHPLFSAVPEQMTVFQWHGDTFDLPPGAVLLASSAACVNQAYAVGERILALQFHFEVTPTSVRQMLVGEHGELLVQSAHVQTPDIILANIAYAEDNCRIMATLLDQLEAVARRG